MNIKTRRHEAGTSLVELLLSITIILVFAGATVSLYTANLKRYGAEQQTAAMNQTARNALELMSLELQQAGSHPDARTTSSAAIIGSNNAQTVSVASTDNISSSDWVTIDPGTGQEETFQVTAVGTGTLTGKVTKNHAAGVPVCLFARPYQSGIISSLGANAWVTTNQIKFFGDINNDGTLYYVEYTHNASTKEILRSITPLSSNSKAAATPIAEGVSSFNVTLYSDSQADVTKVWISITVNSANAKPVNQVTMSNIVMVRSVAAASNLSIMAQQYFMTSRLPSTPAKVVTWAN